MSRAASISKVDPGHEGRFVSSFFLPPTLTLTVWLFPSYGGIITLQGLYLVLIGNIEDSVEQDLLEMEMSA